MKDMTNIHYFYKITNNINGKFYYGVHNTNNLNDGYMGSGKHLHKAYEKYGIENFTKEILKYFSTSNEAFEYEKSFVTEELVKNSQCYNMKTGGDGWQNQYIKRDKIVVTDGIKVFQIDKNDERYLSGELKPYNEGRVNVKDLDGNTFSTSVTDERYLSGELIPVNKGRHLSDEHKKKLSEIAKGKAKKGFFKQRPKRCWVHKNENGIINKSILLSELDEYINEGWIKGRKTGTLCLPKTRVTNEGKHINVGEQNPNYGTVYVYRETPNGFESIRVPKEMLDVYISDGWNKGRKIGKTKRNYMENKHYPSKDDVLKQYEILHSWERVAKHFGLTRKIIQGIRNR